ATGTDIQKASTFEGPNTKHLQKRFSRGVDALPIHVWQQLSPVIPKRKPTPVVDLGNRVAHNERQIIGGAQCQATIPAADARRSRDAGPPSRTVRGNQRPTLETGAPWTQS